MNQGVGNVSLMLLEDGDGTKSISRTSVQGGFSSISTLEVRVGKYL